MAAQNPPSFLQNVATETAAQGRNLITGLLQNLTGVIGSGDLTTAQHGTPNMSVDCAGGAAFIAGSSATLQGTYHVYSDSTLTNLVISTADPTNPRIDRVVAQIEDAVYAGSNNDWKYAVVTGTPTSGATLANLNGVGAAPASSITLAYVLVPANATSIVTADLLDARPFAPRVETSSTTQVGPPTAATPYIVGDRFRDKWGGLWVCSVSGSPGSWRYVGGGAYFATARKSSAQTIANATDSVLISFDIKDFDPSSSFNTGTGQYFALVTGLYRVTWNVGLNPTGTLSDGECFSSVFVNGVSGVGQQTGRRFAKSGLSVGTSGSAVVQATAGQSIDVRCYAAGGASGWTVSGNSFANFELVGSAI